MVSTNFNKITTAFTIFILTLFMCFSITAQAGEATLEQKVDRKEIAKVMDESFGMPVLKGDLWTKMSHDEKIAFVWGFGHVVSIESYIMEKYPELKRDSFVSKVVEGMDNMPMNEVISKVDRYYGLQSAQLDKPVTSVLWDEIIRPKIKTGIAGHPIKKQ